jgi:2-dehydro-3-deoxyglucarate aldolase
MDRAAVTRELRARLRAGGATIGSWMQIPHTSVAEIMGQAGYDWVALDLEHGAIALHQLPDLCRALELGRTLPLARIARADPKDCKQALDAGVGGVIVPMIESAEQLAAVRDWCRWPPAGTRGVGFSRANLFGRHFDAYRAEAQEPLLVAMIEHERAVSKVGEIAAVDGLDAMLIGPYDLSASMGLTGQFESPRYGAAVSEIRLAAERAHLPCGVHVVTPSRQALQASLSLGFRFIAYGTDALFLMHGSKREE